MSPVNYAARISKAYSRNGIFSLVYIFSDLVSSYRYRIASGPLTWPKVVMSTNIPLIGFHDRAGLPLMRRNDDLSLESISNDEVIAVNQASGNNCKLFCSASQAAWIADVPESADLYLALFSLTDGSATVAAGIGKVSIRDLRSHQELGSHKGTLEVELPPHGAGPYRLCPTG